MSLSLVYVAPYPVSAATPGLVFSDLDGYEWAADAFSVLKTAGIIGGDAEGNANPGGTIARAEFSE